MPNVSHFVSGIQWGAIAIATVKYAREKNDDENVIKAALKVFVMNHQILD